MGEGSQAWQMYANETKCAGWVSLVFLTWIIEAVEAKGHSELWVIDTDNPNCCYWEIRTSSWKMALYAHPMNVGEKLAELGAELCVPSV